VPLFGRRGRARFRSPADTEIEVLVAAAEAVRLKDGYEYRRTLPVWQKQALEFYDLLGEAWYPSQFYARMLSRVRLFPGIRLPNNQVEESEDAQAQEILYRIKDSGGGSAQWKAAYGRLQFLIGDGYLAVSLDDDGGEQWEYLSPAELIVESERTYLRRMGEGIPDKTYEKVESLGDDGMAEGQMKAWRLWRRHPTHTDMADSPMRAVAGLMTYLMYLDKAALAQAISRIVGTGLFVVDERITIPGNEPEAGDETVEDDPFMRRLTDYMVRPIRDPGSAASQAPLVARVEPPEGMSVREMTDYIQFHNPNATADWEVRIEKTIRRIAISLDMPPEEFLGLANANQWVGWLITEEKWKAHGEPVTIQLCGDITSAYYRQACIDAKVANAEKLEVWFDPAQVVSHPDQGKSANETHDRGGLSDRALRSAHNFSENDAPDAAEREAWETIKLRRPPRPPDKPEDNVSPTGAHVEPGAPENGGRRTNQPSPQPEGQQMRALGAAELALDRLRERAGSVIRSRKMSCEDCFRGTEDVPNAELAARVGQEIVRALDITSELALVSGGSGTFAARLIGWGYSEHRAKVIAGVLEQIAAETLYEEHAALPEDFTEVL